VVKNGNEFAIYRNQNNEVVWDESINNLVLSNPGDFLTITINSSGQTVLKYKESIDVLSKESHIDTTVVYLSVNGLTGQHTILSNKFVELDGETEQRIYGEYTEKTIEHSGPLVQRPGLPISERYFYKNNLLTFTVNDQNSSQNGQVITSGKVADYAAGDSFDFYLSENLVDGQLASYTVSKLINNQSKGEGLYTVINLPSVSVRNIVENHELRISLKNEFMARFTAAQRSQCGSNNFDASVDLKNDGNINIADFGVFVDKLNKGELVWLSEALYNPTSPSCGVGGSSEPATSFGGSGSGGGGSSASGLTGGSLSSFTLPASPNTLPIQTISLASPSQPSSTPVTLELTAPAGNAAGSESSTSQASASLSVITIQLPDASQDVSVSN
jgi:hypothetical protein